MRFKGRAVLQSGKPLHKQPICFFIQFIAPHQPFGNMNGLMNPMMIKQPSCQTFGERLVHVAKPLALGKHPRIWLIFEQIARIQLLYSNRGGFIAFIYRMESGPSFFENAIAKTNLLISKCPWFSSICSKSRE